MFRDHNHSDLVKNIKYVKFISFKCFSFNKFTNFIIKNMPSIVMYFVCD